MFQGTSIRRKQTLIVMLTSGIALLLACGAFIVREVVTYRQDLLRDAMALAQVLGPSSETLMRQDDKSLAVESLAVLAAYENIVAAVILDAEGEVFARYDRDAEIEPLPSANLREPWHAFAPNRLHLGVPLGYDDAWQGALLLIADQGAVRAGIRKYVATGGLVFTACLLLAYLLSNSFQRVLSRPILNLVATTREVTQNRNFSVRAVKTTDDEMGVLVDAFNDMLQQIEARETELHGARADLERRVTERTQELNQARELADREQSRLKLIFDTVPMGIALRTVDADGNETNLVNSVQGQICGLDDSRDGSERFFELTVPEDREKQRELHDRLNAGEIDHYSLEKRYLRPDGKLVWVYFSVQRRREQDGGYDDLSTAVDITALKAAQQEANYERDLLRGLLDYSPDYIYFKDLESRFVMVSAFQARQFGFDCPSEIKGKSDFDFFSEQHARDAYEDEQQIIRTGVPILGKVERETWKNKDGNFWVLTSKMPWRNKEGEIIGTFGMSRDITAMKEAEEKLEQVHQQLLVTSRQAGMAEIATSVLHNVGNVLNTVNVSAGLVGDRLRNSRIASLGKVASLLREHENDLGAFLTSDSSGRRVPEFLGQLFEHLEAEQQMAVEEMDSLQKNIEHIKEIVSMQQNFARVSGVTQTVDLHELVDDSVRMEGESMNRHGVELVREYGEVPPVTLDRHKVLQILVNLVRNAKRACQDSGRGDKRITLRLENGGDTFRVSVIDNGIGIPSANLTRIFSHGFSTRPDGHGFGLHSSALVARELGGTLEVYSGGEGCGASFTLTLPLTPS